MDRDGVEAEVLYSEVTRSAAFGLVRGDWRPISRAFSDHLSDFAAHDPDRLAVSYQVPIIDIPYAVSEVERLAAAGARSVHLPNFPSELGLPDYHEQLYDPLWGVLQETGLSISHHLGNRNSLWEVFRRDPTPQSAIFTSLPAMALAEVVAWWILTGTLERFPGLQIVFVEPSLHWIPGFLAQLDRKVAGPYNLPEPAPEAERVLPPQHRGHVHGRRGRAEHASSRRHREHSLVDRLPAPGDDVAALAGSRGASVRGDPGSRARADLLGELGAHLPPLIRRL